MGAAVAGLLPTATAPTGPRTTTTQETQITMLAQVTRDLEDRRRNG